MILLILLGIFGFGAALAFYVWGDGGLDRAWSTLIQRRDGRAAYVWDVVENPHRDYQSPAMQWEPAPGVRVQAPAGALDKPRDVEARILSETEVQALNDTFAPHGIAVVSALKLDAGMERHDRFREPVTFSFDLAELGIPEDVRPFVTLMISDEGDLLHPAFVEREGDVMIWRSQHNAFLIFALPTASALLKYVGLIGVIGAGKAAHDYYEETGGISWTGVASRSGRFHVWWPSEQHEMSDEGKATLARLDALRTERQGASRRWWFQGSADHDAKTSRAELARLERKVADPQWLAEHWNHPAATPVAESLDYAMIYLRRRGFHPPGHVVNVYLREPWEHGAESLGFAERRLTRRPFISVSLGHVVSTHRDGGVPGTELDITLLHEVFHVLQSNYGASEYWDRNAFWIGEATALVLEHEAWPAYRRRFGGVQSDFTAATTVRNLYWWAYRLPVEPLNVISDNDEILRHGYGMSHFFEYLRDHAYSGRRERFLVDFFNALNRERAAVLALQSITEGAIADHYVAFVSGEVESIQSQSRDRDRERVAVRRDARQHRWPATSVLPLSSEVYRVAASDEVVDFDRAVAVLETSDLDDRIVLRWAGLVGQGGRRTWVPVSGGSDSLMLARHVTPRGADRFGGFLQVVGGYAPQGGLASRGDFGVTFLFPPSAPKLPQAPEASLERVLGGDLRVDVDGSPLAVRPDFRYVVHTKTKRNGSVVQEHKFEADRRRSRRLLTPFRDVLPSALHGEDAEFEVQVTVSESILVDGNRVEGRPSEAASMVVKATRELKHYNAVNRSRSIREEFSYYDTFQGMPDEWVAGFRDPTVIDTERGTYVVFPGNASSFRWLLSGNDGAHDDKVIDGPYKMYDATTGHLIMSANFRLGAFHGPMEFFFGDSGRQAGHGSYVNGRIDGTWVGYTPNGRVGWREEYRNGEFVSRRFR